jgi:dienelactone hydrolase
MLAEGAPDAPLASLAGGETGRIVFESLTLPEAKLLTVSKEGAPALIWGELRLPHGGPDRVPAVILVHGAAGIGANLGAWAGELVRMGIASFTLDSFAGRGFKEIRTGGSRINMGSRLNDAYRALELLATHPRIDPSRIALMGFSHGGAVVLWARHTRFQRLWMTGGRDFAAYLAFYPAGCNFQLLDEAQVSDRPLRIFHGEADDQTVIAPCREYVERMRRAGKPAELIEYAGAHHGFDTWGDSRALTMVWVEPAYNPHVLSARNCTFVERQEGGFAIFHRDTGRPATPEAPCMTRGITIGYDRHAHRRATFDVRAFLEATLKAGR